MATNNDSSRGLDLPYRNGAHLPKMSSDPCQPIVGLASGFNERNEAEEIFIAALPVLEQRLTEHLLDFERLDEAWPRGRTAIEQAEIGRQREDALSGIVALWDGIVTGRLRPWPTPQCSSGVGSPA